MMRWWVLLLLLVSAGQCRGELPALFAQQNPKTCAVLADAVNHYVALGEETTVKEIGALENWAMNREHQLIFPRNARIAAVCRILFSPKGEKPLRRPDFGDGRPYRLSWMPPERWPLFPVVASGGSYFILLESYEDSRRVESPAEYLRYCRANGTFRKTPIPRPARAQALQDAERLRQSDAWKAIQWREEYRSAAAADDAREQTWAFIKSQAENISEK